MKSIALALALSLLCAEATARQFDQTIVDHLEVGPPLGVDRLDSSTMVFCEQLNFSTAAKIHIFEAAPGTTEYLRTAVLAPPVFLPGARFDSASVEGNLIALHAVLLTGPAVVIHERGPQGWSTRSVSLPGTEWRLGKVTAISGGVIAAVSAPGHHAPVTLNIIEQSAAGNWSITDSVLLNVNSPWVDYSFNVAHDDGVAAVGQRINSWGPAQVAVCERGANGSWSQVATLPPPVVGDWSVENLAVRSGVLAVLRVRYDLLPLHEQVLQLYERNASGSWTEVARTMTAANTQSFDPSSVVIDGNSVVLSSYAETRIFERATPGTLVERQTIESPLRVAVGLENGRLAMARKTSGPTGGGTIVLVDLPAAPSMTQVRELRGQTTCLGTGSSRLRVHDGRPPQGDRRVVAEIGGAPVGATTLLFRAADPGSLPVLGGLLCIDRRGAALAAAPGTANAAGRATFELDFIGSLPLLGYAAADHLQAVVIGPAPELTNSVAWLP